MLFIARHECGTNAAHAAAARRGCKPLVCCERADDDALDAAVICRTCVPVEQYRGELGCGVWRRRRSRPSSHNGAVCLQPRPLQPPLRNGQNPRFLRITLPRVKIRLMKHVRTQNAISSQHRTSTRTALTHTHTSHHAHTSPHLLKSFAVQRDLLPPSSCFLLPASLRPPARAACTSYTSSRRARRRAGCPSPG